MVDAEITQKILHEETQALLPLSESYNWQVTTDLSSSIVSVELTSSIDDEIYIVEAECHDYKAIPPFFEFIHPDTKEKGTQACYPKGGTYFHKTPCICVQWNRKAYKQHGGPHRNWDILNWQNARPGTTMLGDMFLLIQLEINKPGQYEGRMA